MAVFNPRNLGKKFRNINWRHDIDRRKVEESVSLRSNTIEIGDWNMDSTATVYVSHKLGSLWTRVRHISALIRNDSDDARYEFMGTFSVLAAENIGQSIGLDNIQYILVRDTDGFFDGVNFNATGYNRGWITAWYEPEEI